MYEPEAEKPLACSFVPGWIKLVQVRIFRGMRSMIRLSVVVLLGINLSLLAPVIEARPWMGHGGEQRSVRMHLAASKVTLEQAAARVRNESGGKLLSAEEQQRDNGRSVYRIKVLTPGGIVRVIYIDPVSGARIQP